MKQNSPVFLAIFLILPIFSPFMVSADVSNPFDSLILEIVLTSPEGGNYEHLKKKLPLQVGEKLTSRKIKECLKMLYQTGEFSNVIVDSEEIPGGILVKFTLLNKLRVGSIRWKGNNNFLKNSLEDYLKLKINDELKVGWEKQFQTQLEFFYREQGYFNTRIEVMSAPLVPSNRLRINFMIKEGDQSTLGRIRFTGNIVFPERSLLEAFRIYPGYYYSKNKIHSYLDRVASLYHRERFLKVKISDPILHVHSDGKVDLEIPIEAGPQIFVDLSFAGKRHYLYSTLIKLISVDEEQSVDQSVLEESVNHLVDFYQNEGYPLVKVKAESQELSDGKILRALFYITEGPRVVLKDVVFKGNVTLPDDLLQNSISHQKTAYWIPKYVHIPAIANDVQSLVEVYRTKGFLFTEVKDAIQYSEDKNTAVISFNITEGVRTMVKLVRFEGISPLYLPNLQKIVHTQKSGFYYNGTILQDKAAIAAFYHKKGYADVTIEATALFDDNEKKNSAEISFKVDEGSKIKIGHIRLTGNNYTRANVILREVDFKTGDYFQEDLILKSQRKIARLGYFQSVRIKPVNVEEESTDRDLEIQVKERNPGAVEFGGGYADVEGLNGFAEVSDKNIAGTGRIASFRTEVSQIGDKELISYTEPWVFNFPLNARSTVFFNSLYNPYINYTLRSLGGSVGVDKSIWDYYKLSLFYQYENDRYIDVPQVARQAPEDYNDANISSLNPSIIRDTRDDFLNPTKGTYNAIWVRWAARFMGGETQEVKVSLQSSRYLTVAPRMTMAVSARSGIAFPFGETEYVPISERFTVGGRSTVRGYPENMLGTLNQTIDQRTLSPLGGESMVVLNWELRYNLPKSLGIVLFFDSGNVWEKYYDFWSSPLKSSVGPGLRYNTPVGPLRIDLGFKLNREYWESSSELHFALGHAF